MWRNPSLPPPEPRPAPQETGERLATLPRGPSEELRVSLDTYEGRPYVSVRLWAAGQDGQMWPTKKGTSVRVRELAEVARALMVARDLVEGPPRRPSVPARRAGRPTTSRGYAPCDAPRRPELPGLNGPAAGGDFDEFGDV